MRLKNRKKSAAAIKSMKVGTDELKDLIKGAVKEAMGEEDDTGDDGRDTAAALDGVTAEDMADIIEQAVDNANEKRKSRKDAGEEVGDLTADEVIQEAAEITQWRKKSCQIQVILLQFQSESSELSLWRAAKPSEKKSIATLHAGEQNVTTNTRITSHLQAMREILIF